MLANYIWGNILSFGINYIIADAYTTREQDLSARWLADYVIRKNWVNYTYHINSLGPGFHIWHHRTWSPPIQVMVWYFMALSHYMNQCWCIINEALWVSHWDNFAGIDPLIYTTTPNKSLKHLQLQPYLPTSNELMPSNSYACIKLSRPSDAFISINELHHNWFW